MKEQTNTQYRDMLDIIFANRNKAYGAYLLRRDYPHYLSRAFAMGLLFIAALCILPRVWGAVAAQFADKADTDVIMTLVDLPTPPAEQPPPPPKEPVPPPPPAASRAYVPPVVLKDVEVPEDTKTLVDEILEDTRPIGKTTQEGTTEPPDELPTEEPGQGAVEAPKPQEPEDEILDGVQKMPSFPGGDAALMAFLRNHIEYPALARENNIQGTVAIQFVVGKDGSISDVKVMKEPGGGCAKEAVRVLGLMPRWMPGEANGNPVRVRFTLPVRFRLQS